MVEEIRMIYKQLDTSAYSTYVVRTAKFRRGLQSRPATGSKDFSLAGGPSGDTLVLQHPERERDYITHI